MADAIVTAALPWEGQGYVFGGPGWPPGDWDCSSFVSEILGRQLHLQLPGGLRWGTPNAPPNDHGPDVHAYAQWGGAVTVASPAPGDLIIWDGQGGGAHIGIYLGPDQMISALNPSLGVRKSGIAGNGPSGRSPDMYRRVAGVPGSVQTGPGAPAIDVVAAWRSALPGLPGLRGILVPATVVAGLVVGSVLLAGVLYVGGVLLFGVLAAMAGRGAVSAVRRAA